jgi:hypothetical protein
MMKEARASSEDVVRIFGDLEDETVVEILATGATIAEVEAAALWLAQESDVMGEARRPLDGRAAQVYNIVNSAAERADEM